jgi:ABC-type dipeptide/oligopeptide/nickel transport system ATPase component
VSDLLQVRDLHVRFAAPGGFIRAVTGVSFRVRAKSIVAVVGESWSGK